MVTGGVFSLIFHVGLREIPLEQRAQLEGNTLENSINSVFTWKQWFREPQFYVVSSLNAYLLKNSSADFLSAVLFYRPSLIWVRARIESATNENATLLSTTEWIGSHWIFSFFSKNFPFYKVNTKLRCSSKFFQFMNIEYVLSYKLFCFLDYHRFWAEDFGDLSFGHYV